MKSRNSSVLTVWRADAGKPRAERAATEAAVRSEVSAASAAQSIDRTEMIEYTFLKIEMPGDKPDAREVIDAPENGPRAQPETRVQRAADFFIWIRRNPLKSLDSAKRIQGNASFFPWISLDFLAANSRAG
ncbi:MAG TPA: hypothetical protein VIJ63_15265 [Roseiarcus sp.]